MGNGGWLGYWRQSNLEAVLVFQVRNTVKVMMRNRYMERYLRDRE